MENLDLCILRFHYGLHPGHNLRKTAGKSTLLAYYPAFVMNPRGLWTDVCFWLCQVLDKSSPMKTNQPVIYSAGSLRSHLQSRLSCGSREERNRDCMCPGEVRWKKLLASLSIQMPSPAFITPKSRDCSVPCSPTTGRLLRGWGTALDSVVGVDRTGSILKVRKDTPIPQNAALLGSIKKYTTTCQENKYFNYHI